MPALISEEQRHVILGDGEPLEDVGRFEYIGSVFPANSQNTEELRGRINHTLFTFSRMQPCLWKRSEIPLHTKDRVHQAVERSILLIGCST